MCAYVFVCILCIYGLPMFIHHITSYVWPYKTYCLLEIKNLNLKRKTAVKEKLPSGFIVHHYEKGWMDKTWWTSGCPQAMWKVDISDNQRACWCSILCVRTSDVTKERIRSTGSIPAVIPGGLTKILQPLDISVNTCFTTEVRKLWEAWMSDGEKSYIATERMRRAYYQTVC